MVLKIAGLACREVDGVHAMGDVARRPFGGLTDRRPGSEASLLDGITIEKGERQTAVDITVIVEYGFSIVEVSQAIRAKVIEAVEHGTGLEVTEVNINVTDVHLPGDGRAAEIPVGRVR